MFVMKEYCPTNLDFPFSFFLKEIPFIDTCDGEQIDTIIFSFSFSMLLRDSGSKSDLP